LALGTVASEQAAPMSSGATSSQMLGSPRRLAAILCADIAGYSRLMGKDEEGTLARIKRYRREITEPTVAEHSGRIIKNTGDGFLALFDSPLEAVRCSIVIQQSMAGRNTALPKQQWVQFRIGVNLGDVIVDPDDIYGEGVNIAARLEHLAEPGSVYISGGVYEQIKNKLVCGYQSLGDEKLKHITDPVRIYRVLPDLAAVTRAQRTKRLKAGFALGMLASAGAAGWYAWQIVTPGHSDLTASVEAALPSQPSASAEATASRTAPLAVTGALAPAARPVPPPAVAPSQPIALPGLPPAPPTVGEAPNPVPPSPFPPAPAAPPVPEARPQSVSPQAAPPQAGPVQVAAIPVQRSPNRPPATAAVFRDCQQCPEMINIPSGTFTMGSSDDPSERPVHQVMVAPFALGRFPVTIGEWRECVAANACSYVPDGDPDLPVHNVNWADAQQYVGWLSKITQQDYRLPTEAEWEYAARAGAATRYWWGDQLVSGMANCKGCGGLPYDQHQPVAVGSFPPNAFGLHDMAGGVAQWVSDCWFKDYQGAPKDGSSRNQANCREHVLRGGSWMQDPSYVSVSSRSRYDTGVRYIAHGVRVARAPKRSG
jgi:formylglycine-generating enzyme required for sulfatase activity/class 3 adenylate cyclase